eukprot:5064929-Pyramimonas_sp.AAC.1
MSCIAHGGLRGLRGKMFQHGQDCPNAFGHEPIARTTRSAEMVDEAKLTNLIKEAKDLLHLAKNILGYTNLERRYRSGCATEYDASRLNQHAPPNGQRHEVEMRYFNSTRGAGENNNHGGNHVAHP